MGSHHQPDQADRASRAAEPSPSADREQLLRIFTDRLFSHQPSHLTDVQRNELAVGGFEFFAERTEPIKIEIRAATRDGADEIIIETCMLDCPFIVDSIREYFYELDVSVVVMLHPVMSVARDPQGRIVSIEQHRRDEVRESFIHAELVLAAGVPGPAEIERDLHQVLDEVWRATADFAAMTARAMEICEQTAPSREFVEIRDFLRWLVQGGFVFLGARRYRTAKSTDGAMEFAADPSSDVGILRDGGIHSRFTKAHPVDDLDPTWRRLLLENSPLIIGKSHGHSRVHRRVAMDDITIRRAGPGNTLLFDRFLGLFTSKAYVEEAEHVPVLRAKLAEIIAAEGAIPGSHDYKELVAAFNSFPKEELFRATTAELRHQVRLILEFNEQSSVRLSIQSDPERGHAIALVVLKREQFSPEVRARIQELLGKRFGGPLVYYYLAMGEARTARMHFCFSAPPPAAAILPELEQEVARIARGWNDRLQDKLVGKYGATRGNELARRWARAFDADYQAANSIDQAAADIAHIDALLSRGDGVEVTVDPPDHEASPAQIRMYEIGAAPLLSDVMPRLQNFGLRVISEDAHEIACDRNGTNQPVFVQIFRVNNADLKPGMDRFTADAIADALRAVSAGIAEDDPLNALTISARLVWRDVAMLRTLVAAAFQMGLAPARPALIRVMVSNPGLAGALIEFFKARLDPDRNGPADEADRMRAKYLDQLAGVDAIADDRAARALLSLADAAVRTNFFVPPPAPDPYIAVKFESAKILNLPDVAPLYEIHVVSPRMAGCHLRAGKIARGGIRYSDRPDDYRVEILDLMKTQTVKNAIIVPIGSKGGFIVKSGGKTPARNDVVAAYKSLIRGMLDLTDNLIDDKVSHPPGLKVLDGNDPYLVVAADKGTAAFSDIANALALERQYWLGDAFASGGEHGYDHKALGITARGAWESAKRHLREMGRDPERGVPITVVGVGDMSGDVFGNGMLQSRNLKLIAAFDHRHIFIDPDPDPAASFNERRRLFELPASQWSDYDARLISSGGGVFRRGQKRIELSPQARSALGCDQDALDSESLIRAILRAPVDMLYNGGIGTYVRAASETDAQVGDHANDSCRVTADELRTRIVVEGGNLGLTQNARIAYALKGGRINTDAIDNSAGVDCSDHEVNLKILLEPAVIRGGLAPGQRNRVIADCANQIADSVLRDNRDQALSLSLEQRRSIAQADAFREHLSAIELRGIVRIQNAVLPPADDLRQRWVTHPGLTRPELAPLTAYTKIELKARLEDAAFIDDPYLVDAFLKPYFSPDIAARMAADLPVHRLRHQIITTRIVNELIDLGGSIFVFSLDRDHGAEAEEAVRAWIISAGVLDLRMRSDRLRAATASLDANSELSAFNALSEAVRRVSGWMLARGDSGPIGPIVDRIRPQYELLSTEFESALAGSERERYEQIYRDLRTTVQHEAVAHDLARLAIADHLLAVLALSFERNLPPMAVAQAYFGMSAAFDFAAVEKALGAIDGDQWARRAARDIELELGATRLELCELALSGNDGCAGVVEHLKELRPREFAVAERTLAEVKAISHPSVPALQVAVRWLTRLARTRWRPGA